MTIPYNYSSRKILKKNSQMTYFISEMVVIKVNIVLLAHGNIHGEFDAIEHLNLLYGLTPLLCQSHGNKCF